MTMLFFALVLLVCCVLVAELAARLLIRRGRYYPWPPSMQLDMHLDPRLNIGDQRIVRIRANELGERAGPIPQLPGTFRILAGGGSIVECYFLDQQNSWPAVLERELAAAPALRRLNATSVHVGNIGKSSADSRVMHLMLQKLSRSYPEKLDVIIIMVGASDILRWMEWGAPANWEGDTSIPLASFFEFHPELEFGLAPKKLALAEIYRRYRDRKPQIRQNSGKSLLRARQYRRQSNNVIDRLETPPDRVFTRFRHYFAAAIEEASRRANRVIITTQPCLQASHYTPELMAGFWNGSIGDPFAGEPKAFFSARLIAELMSELRLHTLEVAAKYPGVTVVDVAANRIPNDAQHYYDQFHLTPKGAAALARILAAAVLQTGAVAERAEQSLSAAANVRN